MGFWFKVHNNEVFAMNMKEGWAWWLTPEIPCSWEADIGGSQFESSLGKNMLVRLHLKGQARSNVHASDSNYMEV
jgi:hypothetical protein